MQKFFHFLDNCIGSGSGKFSLLWRVYASSVVKVLTSFFQTPASSQVKKLFLSKKTTKEYYKEIKQNNKVF